MNAFLSILEKNKDALLKVPSVVSVGIGFKYTGGKKTNKMSIIVGVVKKRPRHEVPREEMVPPLLDGKPTDVIEMGRITFQGHAAKKSPTLYSNGVIRTNKVRPAPPGVSIAHFRVTAGTLGVIVKGPFPGGAAILSNNHVLANLTNGRDGRAALGDLIVQPGPVDGGIPSEDALARLAAFSPLEYISLADFIGGVTPPVNLIDAALAVPLQPNSLTLPILEIGLTNGITEAVPGMTVMKSGRTTGVTFGTAISIHASLNVFGGDDVFRFEDQIVTTDMSLGGDSGSLLLDIQKRAVGLLFAGSDVATFHNPINNVLNTFNVQLIT